jgi:hypothetical protein
VVVDAAFVFVEIAQSPVLWRSRQFRSHAVRAGLD